MLLQLIDFIKLAQKGRLSLDLLHLLVDDVVEELLHLMVLFLAQTGSFSLEVVLDFGKLALAQDPIKHFGGAWRH